MFDNLNPWLNATDLHSIGDLFWLINLKFIFVVVTSLRFFYIKMPFFVLRYDSSMSEACSNLVKSWTLAKGNYTAFKKSDMKDLDSLQQRQFVGQLLDAEVTLEMVKALQEIYELDTIRNSEVRFRWLRLCIKARWADKVKDALAFINSLGRMKFVRPIYRDLYAWESVRNQTIENFQENKKYMMHIVVYTLKKDLKLE